MAGHDLSLQRVTPPTDTASEASLSAHIARFSARLRSHGIDLSLSDEIDALLALQLVDIRTEEQVFLALRTALKVKRRHWSIFNLIFDRMWRQAEGLAALPNPPENERKAAGRLPCRIRLTERTPTKDEVEESNDRNKAGGYTPEEQMRHKTFDECTHIAVRMEFKASCEIIIVQIRSPVKLDYVTTDNCIDSLFKNSVKLDICRKIC